MSLLSPCDMSVVTKQHDIEMSGYPSSAIRIWNTTIVRKNPSADTTVIGVRAPLQSCLPNRFGLYRMTGNVVEWAQSVFKPFNKAKPYDEYERNNPELDGLRVARGGSWYSASVALLCIPYRDAFQPEHSMHDLGFRVVARPLPGNVAR